MTLALLILGGCATTRAPSASHRFAVLPAVWLTAPPENEPPLQSTVVATLESLGHSARSIDAPVDDACGEDLACVVQHTAAGDADKLFVIRVAQLGTTTVIRLQTIDSSGAAEQSAQTAIEQNDTQRLVDAAATLTSRLEAAYRPPTPWYRKPVVIIVAAAAVVAGVTAVALTSGGDAKPDVVIRPP